MKQPEENELEEMIKRHNEQLGLIRTMAAIKENVDV